MKRIGRFCLVFVLLLSGCNNQVFYLRDADVAHFRDVATEIAYPDVTAPAAQEVTDSLPPHTLTQPRAEEIWDLKLEEVVRTALSKSKVIPSLGGVVLQNPDAIPSIFDPALRESDPRFGVEAALSAFDANFLSGVTWTRTDRPVNNAVTVGNFFVAPEVFIFQEDTANFQAEVNKITPSGTRLAVRNRVDYSLNNASSNFFPSAYTSILEFEVRQPLLRGGGVEFGRIAGPGATPGAFNGVVLARINTDIALVDFEQSVRNFISQVEDTYWQLYFAYRELGAQIAARDAALRSWRETEAKYREQLEGGSAAERAQAAEQYYRFEAAVKATLGGSVSFITETSARGGLFGIEAELRRLMGLPINDGKLIRPIDEPMTAPFVPDWNDVLTEALTMRSELRRQKWRIKQRQFEFTTSKNLLYPQLDLVANLRYNGLGDRLSGDNDNAEFQFQNAFETLTGGNYADWQVGVQFSVPIGARREWAALRHAEIQLARERAVLQEQEREVTHGLAKVLRELDSAYEQLQKNFNGRRWAIARLEAEQERFRAGEQSLDVVLRAQEAVVRAETAYYRSALDHTLALKNLQFEKGTLLAYNNVHLSEGSWPEQAYEDAYERARERSHARAVDFGITEPAPFVLENELGTEPGEEVLITPEEGTSEQDDSAPPSEGEMSEGAAASESSVFGDSQEPDEGSGWHARAADE